MVTFHTCIWPPFKHCLSNISFVIVKQTSLAYNFSAACNIPKQQGVRACAFALTLLFQSVGQQCFFMWPDGQTFFVRQIY